VAYQLPVAPDGFTDDVGIAGAHFGVSWGGGTGCVFVDHLHEAPDADA
jgi:hypothetical protein